MTLKAFIKKFTEEKVIDKSQVFMIDKRYFLVDLQLKEFTKKKPTHIGTYLGKEYKESFDPSPNLLNMLKDHTENKAVLDDKTEWLFVCGRDIFEKSISKMSGQGKWKLVLNKRGEVLGVLKARGTVFKNVFDLGNFLRRERSK